MPLRLSINLSRKVGEANYGSRGATVGLEPEAETSLVQRPEEFQQQATHLFRLARESVDQELARPRHLTGNGATANGRKTGRPREARVATANQIRAIHAIADQHAIDLAAELQERFDVSQTEELSLSQASELISALQSIVRAKVLEDDSESRSAAEGG